MFSRIGGLASFLVAGAWAYRWEAIRAFLYDRGFHVMSGVGLDAALHWGMPLLLAGIGLFLFWKTGNGKGITDLFETDWIFFGQVPFDDAARRVYEAAETAGVLDLMLSGSSSAQSKLFHFKMLLMVDNDTPLYGIKPPSTKPRLIPKNELVGSEIYPSERNPNGLDGVLPIDHPPAYVSVTVPRSDLRRVIKKYLTEYVSEARRMKR